jgi:hypothetical protein
MCAAVLTSPADPDRLLIGVGQLRPTPGAPTIWKGTD